jgi:hypothetical protein
MLYQESHLGMQVVNLRQLILDELIGGNAQIVEEAELEQVAQRGLWSDGELLLRHLAGPCEYLSNLQAIQKSNFVD